MDLNTKKALLLQTGGELTNANGVYSYQPPQPALPPAVTISGGDIDAMIQQEQSAIDADNASIVDAQNQLTYFNEQIAAFNDKITNAQSDIASHQATIATLQGYKSNIV